LFVVIGGGHTQLQPVHVADVAEAVQRVIREPLSRGRTYEIGGPRVYTLREIIDAILRELKIHRAKASVPFWLARNISRVLQLLPGSPLTVAQVELLQSDNIPQPGHARAAGSHDKTPTDGGKHQRPAWKSAVGPLIKRVSTSPLCDAATPLLRSMPALGI
jgi:uncharacterized protein YbjT (DUF2867 family)